MSDSGHHRRNLTGKFRYGTDLSDLCRNTSLWPFPARSMVDLAGKGQIYGLFWPSTAGKGQTTAIFGRQRRPKMWPSFSIDDGQDLAVVDRQRRPFLWPSLTARSGLFRPDPLWIWSEKATAVNFRPFLVGSLAVVQIPAITDGGCRNLTSWVDGGVFVNFKLFFQGVFSEINNLMGLKCN